MCVQNEGLLLIGESYCIELERGEFGDALSLALACGCRNVLDVDRRRSVSALGGADGNVLLGIGLFTGGCMQPTYDAALIWARRADVLRVLDALAATPRLTLGIA